MTWFWFVLIGIIALVARASIASWVSNWSEDALKRMTAIGLIGFGIMATFGVAIPADVWWLHLGAALGGIMGFFAVSEVTGRKSRATSVRTLERNRQRLREQRDSGQEPPAGPAPSMKSFDYAEPEPLVRIQEPPLITDRDSPAHILELLERAADQWADPEAEAPAPVPAEPEPKRDSYQSIAEIIARAAKQKQEPASAAEVHQLPMMEKVHLLPPMHSKPEGTGRTAPESRFSSRPLEGKAAPVESAKPVQPASVKLAGTPVMKAAQTLSPDSAVARESGPVILGRSLPLRPPGPLSLGGTSPGPVPLERHAHSGGFHYQPRMIRSRLGQPPPKRGADATDHDEDKVEQPEAKSDGAAAAAELQ